MTFDSIPALALERAYYWEKTTPDRVWLTQPMGNGQVATLTFAQAIGEARRMSAHLRSLQLPPKSQIALMSKNTAHWLIADLAIWMAGHVSVPLYPTLAPETIAKILDHSEARLIFIGKLDGWEGMKAGVSSQLPRIGLPLSAEQSAERWADIVARTAPIEDSPVRPSEELATIIYTSGTTGLPKGVMLSFGAMGTAAAGIVKELSIQSEDRMLSYLPLAHCFERWVVEMGSLVSGFSVYFAEALDTFVQDLQRARPTLFLSVPRLWLKFQAGVLAKMPAKKLDWMLSVPILASIVRKKILTNLGLQDVRFAGTGSAPIPGELVAWYRRLGLELLEGYGMTENFAYSHLSRPGRVRVGYVGEPVPGVVHRISEEGEVQVKSPGTMMGYFKAQEATAEVLLPDGFLRTGDRGEIDEQGRLRLTGRVKELFKTSKGKYVAPAPIESKLLATGRLEQACVTGPGQPQPFALVLPSEETRKSLERGEISRDQLSKELKSQLDSVNSGLDPHEQLEFLTVVKGTWLVENGFLTPTLKIKRAVIEKAYGAFVPSWYGARQPVIWED